ncbi:MAG: tRNA (N(6)-L-threonylcarbamoyladenosine(37)-C(2))-methylthiotransferase MtaB [Chloroflexota bacterium]
MRIYLDQIGCRLNYSEVDTLASHLRAAGHMTVRAPEEAQVIVFNSCAVTAMAGKKSRSQVRKLHQLNPQARIAVTGCWSTLEPEQAKELPGVALVVDNQQKELLHTLLEPWSAELDDVDALIRMGQDGNPFNFQDSVVQGKVPSNIEGNEPVTLDERTSRTRAFIKVQDGCNNKCTFCIVTVARGESKSRSLSSIIAEIQKLTQEGVQEAVLTGVHLGSYGRDLTGLEQCNLLTLTDAILANTDIPRLRLSSLEPWELADGFFDLWQRWPKRLCPHLHLPLQAGTDRQLRRMARRCTQESFRQLVLDARASIPNLIITTDLITGFPGESEADFQDGLAFIQEMQFAHAHIFPFSARAGTAAADFDEHLPKQVKKARSRQLHALIEETGKKERRRFIGATRPVLWEGEGQPLADTADLLWSGLTDNYLRVTATVPPNICLTNTITTVLLESLHGDTFSGVNI